MADLKITIVAKKTLWYYILMFSVKMLALIKNKAIIKLYMDNKPCKSVITVNDIFK